MGIAWQSGYGFRARPRSAMCDECRRLVDDPLDIPDETLLYRRVHWDQLGGRKVYASGETAKLSGNAFSDYSSDRAHLHGRWSLYVDRN